MAWSELTDSEIKSRLSHAEVEAIEETGGGDDRLPGIIDQVTELVRSRVAACSRNTMGTAGTIPAECKHAAAAIARHNLLTSIPSDYVITEKRENEYRDALQFLDTLQRTGNYAVTVVCQPIIRKQAGKIEADVLVETIAASLHNWNPGGQHCQYEMKVTGIEPVNDPEFLIYVIRLSQRININPTI